MRAAKTAITRKVASRPAQWLTARGLARGTVLDYGCGKGTDAAIYGWSTYDPYQPPFSTNPVGDFDTVLCTYVLNVIPVQAERERVLQNCLNMLGYNGGTAYITVRRDYRALTGYKRGGTWQGYIEARGLEVVTSNSAFCIYQIKEAAGLWDLSTFAHLWCPGDPGHMERTTSEGNHE